jgi:hypothetical protein
MCEREFFKVCGKKFFKLLKVLTLKFEKVCGRKFFELLKVSTFKFEVCARKVFQVLESFKFQVCQRESLPMLQVSNQISNLYKKFFQVFERFL